MKTVKLSQQEPQRLDISLAQMLNISRNRVQKAIKNGAILVNNKPATVKQQVNTNDLITYDEKFFIKTKTNKPVPKLNIIYEDENILAINKPANLIVHDAPGNNDPTLVDALLAYYPPIANVGEPGREGLVHRLDKAASGVMIIAKNQDTFQFLKQQFKNREIEKHYTVLVEGKMQKTNGTINLPIERSKNNGRMAAKPLSQGGKPAITHYEVLQSFPHHTLLDVKIETGRTHQIRAHMFAIGHPVVGDTLYRQRGLKPRDIGRIFLHARTISITLPNQERKTFTAPLPKDLQQVLQEIPQI
ncbi:RluA family pseudouridine synthase [Candidatus Parcubacteria bacterium]|nr:MAG: RluA family pseudouridine synthase [Candidatus Parcubacteria bacterium]